MWNKLDQLLVMWFMYKNRKKRKEQKRKEKY